MTTWIIGDIHGCAEELASLIDRLGPGARDHLVTVGDLFHRGPDPVGVMDLLRAHNVRFVLGNHELAVLRRIGLAPRTTDDSKRPPYREIFPDICESDLAGDGDRPCRVAPQRRVEMLRFLQTHSGFLLRPQDLPGAGSTSDGRSWCVVHAGIVPGLPPERNSVRDLTQMRRLQAPGRPWWYERYQGPELIVFGHTPCSVPRFHRVEGRLVALGTDTGCVFGGRLMAYSPELDELVSVEAAKEYARV